MLRGTLAFLVLVGCAVLGAELRAALVRRGVRAPAMEGLSFIVVGVLLGSRGLGLFAEDMVVSLRVVVLFGLAWIGLVFGIQLDLKIIRRLSPRQRGVGILVPTAIGLSVVFGAAAWGLESWMALALGAVAMASSPSPLEGIARTRGARSRTTVQLLRLVMAFAGIPAVMIFAVAAALASPLAASGRSTLPAVELLLLVLAVGVVVGYAVVVLVRGVTAPTQVLTLLIGAMALLAGVAAMLGSNALPAAACAGAVLINRCVFPSRVLRAAHALDRPLLVAMLVLVGASWSATEFAWPVFGVMTGVRAAAAMAAGVAAELLTERRAGRDHTLRLGWGLLPQGELALGLTIATVSFFPDSGGVLEAVVAAMVLNNLAGHWWMRRRLFAERRPGAGP
jgi:Kef-type K+ transport system membrane component KefB